MMLETPLLVSRSFSLGGSITIVATLLIPFFIAFLVSIYQNRLLYYFSEGRMVLTKGNIIASVISATVVPFFLISFGLLGLSQVLGESMALPPLENGAFPIPTGKQALVYVPLTLLLSALIVGWIHRSITSKKLDDALSVQRLMNRWVFSLAAISQVLILGFLWAVLFLFPGEANVQIN